MLKVEIERLKRGYSSEEAKFVKKNWRVVKSVGEFSDASPKCQ
jgi:hypothetical protein